LGCELTRVAEPPVGVAAVVEAGVLGVDLTLEGGVDVGGHAAFLVLRTKVELPSW